MSRPQRDFYCFVYDTYGKYYTASYDQYGKASLVKNATPTPLEFNPANLNGLKIEYGTNDQYFSPLTAMSYPIQFIKDGADIMRIVDYTTKAYESTLFLLILKYDSSDGIYKKYISGKLDFPKSKDNFKNYYTVNLIDYNGWSLLSQNDTTQYQIDCSYSNPKSVKVLFDGIQLIAKYIYQPIQNTPIIFGSYTVLGSEEQVIPLNNTVILPLLFISQDGDSSGILTQTEFLQIVSYNALTYIGNFPANFPFKTEYAATVNISGNYTFTLKEQESHYALYKFYFYRSTDTATKPEDLPADRIIGTVFFPNGHAPTEQTYNLSINQTFDLQAGEWFILVMSVTTTLGIENIAQTTLTPLLENITISTKTKTQPTTASGLRALDVAQELVKRATNGMATINSNFLSLNNNDWLTSGNSLRNSPNAYIQTSFADWFRSMTSKYLLSIRMIDGNLWIEPSTEVYKEDEVLFDIGEIEDLIIEQANDRIYNTIVCGSPKQDFRHTSGRLEFNCEARYSMPIGSIKKEYNIESVYIKSGYAAEFVRLDYQGGNTKDNQNDTSVFMIDISSQKGSAITEVENFVNIEVDHAPLAPIIKYPATNDRITNSQPRLTGIAPASTLINFYVDSVLDGNTTSDANGNWSYHINTVLSPFVTDGVTVISTGVHTIDATFTDETGNLATIKVNIFSDTTPDSITYPINGDSLYNNKPFIKGRAQTGESVVIKIDGNIVATVVADESCNWYYQSSVLSNASHILEANGVSISFVVNSFTSIPLITSFFDGFPIINNLPLVEGVASPSTQVFLYLDYYAGLAVGNAIADANGNWSIQLIPLDQPGTTIPITPISNGAHVLSTDLIQKTEAIQTTAYILYRDNYSQINGVIDNTVFNVRNSPKRDMIAHYPVLAAALYQQQNTQITYQGNDKNQSLSTVLVKEDIYVNGIKLNTFYIVIGDFAYAIEGNALIVYQIFPLKITFYVLTVDVPFVINGQTFLITNQVIETIIENANINQSELGVALYMPRTGSFKTRMKTTFYNAMRFFSNGGVITGSLLGNKLFFKPIGKFSIDDITKDVQSWQLLFSIQTQLSTLLNISKNGIYMSLDTNSIYHSDANTLHFVKYNLATPAKYNFQDIYDNWFNNRNDQWTNNPQYIQKWQTTEILVDQVITNGVIPVLKMYRCSDAKLIDTFPYSPVSPTPIPAPDVVYEVSVDMSLYDEDQYFFAVSATIKNTDSVLLTTPFNKSISASLYIFTLSGTPVAGYNVSVSLTSNGASGAIFDYVVQAGDTIADIKAALIALINANTNYHASSGDTGDNLGIAIEVVPNTNTLGCVVAIYTTTDQNIFISERIVTSDKWENTILIEAFSSSNKVDVMYSTGFRSVFRVEGYIKKWSPKMEFISNEDEVANNELLYSLASRKTTVLIGDAAGTPDYLYLKILAAVILDNLMIEGISFVPDKENKFEEVDKYSGFPMYQYALIVEQAINQTGVSAISGQTQGGRRAVLVADAAAFGIVGQTTIDIEVE